MSFFADALSLRTNRTLRRPPVIRQPSSFDSVRSPAAQRYLQSMPGARTAERYKSGVYVALGREGIPILREVKRLAEKSAEQLEAERRARDAERGFFWRKRYALCAVAALLVIVIVGGLIADSVYRSNTLFTGDEEINGTATIIDRVTTSPELAEKVTYLLIVGVDAGGFNTDCIWLMCYDIEKSTANVLQIPRDTYVGSDSFSGKINGVYSNPKTVNWCTECEYAVPSDERADGRHTVCGTKTKRQKESNISALIRCINTHLGMPVDHFVLFDFEGFKDIVDLMGGVKMTLEQPLDAGYFYLPAGENLLDGNMALTYMRCRSAYSSGDVGRVDAQKIFINALLNQALKMNVSDMIDLVFSASEYFSTDLSLAEIKDYALAARSLSAESFAMYTMPGYDHWVRPNPSYFVCSEKATAEMLNQYFLPYGLPDGSMASGSTVNFPEVVDLLPPASESTTGGESTTTGGESTTTGSETTGGESTTTGSETTTTTGSETTTTTTTTATTTTTTTATTTTTTTAATTTTTAAPEPAAPPQDNGAVGGEISG